MSEAILDCFPEQSVPGNGVSDSIDGPSQLSKPQTYVSKLIRILLQMLQLVLIILLYNTETKHVLLYLSGWSSKGSDKYLTVSWMVRIQGHQLVLGAATRWIQFLRDGGGATSFPPA